MTTANKPGQVCVATVRGVEGVRVMRLNDGLSSAVWASVETFPHRLHEDHAVTDVRPLVVLDLGSDPHLTLNGLDSALSDFMWNEDIERAAVKTIRDAIEAVTS